VSLGVQVQWLLEMHANPGQPEQLTPALPWYRVALRLNFIFLLKVTHY